MPKSRSQKLSEYRAQAKLLAKQKEIVEQIAEAGRRRTEALAAHNQVVLELSLHAQNAVESGIPISEIAELSGVTRRTVYDMLQRAREANDR